MTQDLDGSAVRVNFDVATAMKEQQLHRSDALREAGGIWDGLGYFEDAVGADGVSAVGTTEETQTPRCILSHQQLRDFVRDVHLEIQNESI